jgi:excisionase family DNA binding protein
MEATVMQTASDRTESGPLLGAPEAAEILGVGLSVVYRAARAGQIPAVRIGRRMYVPRALLLQMLGIEESAR